MAKITVEIGSDLLERAQRLAREENRTFSSVVEEGLGAVLQRQRDNPEKLPQLVTVRGSGLTDEFKNSSWERIRDEIYRSRGA